MSRIKQLTKHKSGVFFARSFHPVEVRTLSALLGMPIVDNLRKYVGVPIIHNRVNKNTYQYVDTRVIKKLSSWHAKS